jgi:hypothetical protein
MWPAACANCGCPFRVIGCRVYSPEALAWQLPVTVTDTLLGAVAIAAATVAAQVAINLGGAAASTATA